MRKVVKICPNKLNAPLVKTRQAEKRSLESAFIGERRANEPKLLSLDKQVGRKSFLIKPTRYPSVTKGTVFSVSVSLVEAAGLKMVNLRFRCFFQTADFLFFFQKKLVRIYQ